ncbi:hypothetical protein [Alteromonas gilva]|uniref:DUF481 domain-containing protein n=1 Tax=Alteromonas gilva TaxID=2987522 RepID=A0ABT5L9U8_9ALTE|nr:hypothetical protein [Alteromonas gilva]MDC8832883.1 hypothetical protein [Alteromonas gilva]
MKLTCLTAATLAVMTSPSNASHEQEERVIRVNRREVVLLTSNDAVTVDYRLNKRWAIQIEATSADKVCESETTEHDIRKKIIVTATLQFRF